jgi:hypothetical protein
MPEETLSREVAINRIRNKMIELCDSSESACQVERAPQRESHVPISNGQPIIGSSRGIGVSRQTTFRLSVRP